MPSFHKDQQTCKRPIIRSLIPPDLIDEKQIPAKPFADFDRNAQQDEQLLSQAKSLATAGASIILSGNANRFIQACWRSGKAEHGTIGLPVFTDLHPTTLAPSWCHFYFL